MPVGDCQREFAQAAADDLVVLGPQSFPWLCEQGHFGLARIATDDEDADPYRLRVVMDALDRIYKGLGGDLDVLRTGRTNPLRGDFVHEPSGTLIEIDETQHFTTFRLQSLELYPEDIPLGFEIARYARLCEEWRAKSDGYRRTKAARGFGIGGRQKQRAYYDALRDLATPAVGRPPLIRIDATSGDGRAAYRFHRARLQSQIGA